MSEPTYLGVTPPISHTQPTAKDREVTATLLAELTAQNSFEKEQEARTREVVLGRVSALVKKFVKTVSLTRGMSETMATAAGGKIFTFGSYRLGVHGPGADIDTLCVVPKHVSRDDFFEVFEPMLKATEGAKEVSGVPDAYVPIITSEISGIPIDFLMARLPLASIPEDLSLKTNDILKNLDEKCVRSLNGSRVTDEILRLVPNLDVFRISLRCIKLWAQRRAVYSNVNGFLGGVAWAMLVARICQLYPNAVAGAIVGRFFMIMYQWPWPQPVMLKQIEDGPLQLYPGDKAHRMPIITPAYPSMCSTHNVTSSTHMIMTQELKRGADIIDKIMVGTATWSELFQKHDFFQKYRFYLQVTASTPSAELQMKWSGLVESRMRQLVMKLEYVDALSLVHPFTKGFEHVVYCLTEEEAKAAALGDVSPELRARTKADTEGKEGASEVHTATFFVGIALHPKQPGAVGPQRLDLSFAVSEFSKQVKSWEGFDETTMQLSLRHIKSVTLPDYVFGEGERQPPKVVKKRARTGPDGPNKKRRLEVTPSVEAKIDAA